MSQPRILLRGARALVVGFNRVLRACDRIVRASSPSRLQNAFPESRSTLERMQVSIAELQSAESLHAAALQSLVGEVRETRHQLASLATHLTRRLLESEDYLLDLLQLQPERLMARNARKLQIVTEHPISWDSADHRFPRGTRNDNTRHPRFVRKCAQLFGRPVFHLDLGCAGGGLVWDFLLAGHTSYGVEGSDYSLARQRALWRVIPDRLFTADITKPFHFVDAEGHRCRFDIVTAWEVLEHIPVDGLRGLFANLRENLADGGLFVGSVATFVDHDPETGVVWHVTVRPKEWWIEQFNNAGFQLVEGLFEPGDYVRGSGNPRADDWDAAAQPQLGFHLTVRRT